MPWVIGLVFSLGVHLGAIWLGWNLCGRPRRSENLWHPMVLMWFGWFIQAVILGLAGWSGLFRMLFFSLLWTIPLAGLVLDRSSFFPWFKSWLQPLFQISGSRRGVVFFTGIIAFWLSFPLTVRPFFYDTLFYAYGQALNWLNEGVIRIEQPDVFAFVAVPQRLHFAWSLAMGGDPQVAWSLFLWFLAGGSLLGAILEDAGFSSSARITGFLIYLTVPALWEILLLRKDDMAVVWGGAVLIYLFSYLRKKSADLWQYFFFGLAGGILLTAKQTGTPALVVGAFLYFLIGKKKWLSALGIIAMGASIPVMFYAVHNYLGSGSILTPLAPYLSSFDIASSRWRGLFDDTDALWRYPLNQWGSAIVWAIQRFYVPEGWHFAGFLGFVVLIFLPASLLINDPRLTPLTYLWLTAFAGFLLTTHLPRYSLSWLGVSIVLVTGLFESHKKIRRFYALLIIAFVLHLAIFINHPVTGSAVRQLGWLRWGRTTLPLVPSALVLNEWINTHLDPAHDRILYVGETRFYPCRIPFVFWDPYFRHPLERLKADEEPEELWDRWVLSHHITHIVYTPSEARRLFEWPETIHRRFEKWLNARTRVIARVRQPGPPSFLLVLTLQASP